MCFCCLQQFCDHYRRFSWKYSVLGWLAGNSDSGIVKPIPINTTVPGLEIATDTVAFATKSFPFATKTYLAVTTLRLVFA